MADRFFTNMSCLRITICNMYFIFLETAMTPHSKSVGIGMIWGIAMQRCALLELLTED